MSQQILISTVEADKTVSCLVSELHIRVDRFLIAEVFMHSVHSPRGINFYMARDLRLILNLVYILEMSIRGGCQSKS